jgi:hypothetical protein
MGLGAPEHMLRVRLRASTMCTPPVPLGGSKPAKNCSTW